MKLKEFFILVLLLNESLEPDLQMIAKMLPVVGGMWSVDAYQKNNI